MFVDELTWRMVLMAFFVVCLSQGLPLSFSGEGCGKAPRLVWALYFLPILWRKSTIHLLNLRINAKKITRRLKIFQPSRSKPSIRRYFMVWEIFGVSIWIPTWLNKISFGKMQAACHLILYKLSADFKGLCPFISDCRVVGALMKWDFVRGLCIALRNRTSSICPKRKKYDDEIYVYRKS